MDCDPESIEHSEQVSKNADAAALNMIILLINVAIILAYLHTCSDQCNPDIIHLVNNLEFS